MRGSLAVVALVALVSLACRTPAQADARETPAPASATAPVTASVAATAPVTAPVTATATVTAPAPASSGPDPRKGKVVLHIGDSFTYAHFEQNLSPRFGKLGVRYRVAARNSTYTTTWANPGEIGPHLWQKPALVIISLGANEWEMPQPKVHENAVRELVKQVSKVSPCVWVSPPSWKPSTGFKEIIRDNIAPCLFFDSDAHVPNIERQRDGIHPNEVGGARWAAIFWDWLEAHRDPESGPYALKPGAPAP